MDEIKKEYQVERFEFSLWVNENLICKRNFKINNFIEESMQTLTFKYVVDEIVDMIDRDLKSKSRVYSWAYANYETEWSDGEFRRRVARMTEQKSGDDELIDPLGEEWESTFKFVVTDNTKKTFKYIGEDTRKKPFITWAEYQSTVGKDDYEVENDGEVISKIWDGRFYPRYVREHVDIANKDVRIVNKQGTVFTYPKEQYFEEFKDRLNLDMCLLKSMIMDKDNLLVAICRRICETCSYGTDSEHRVLKDYITTEVYGNGKDPITRKDKPGAIEYIFPPSFAKRKMMKKLESKIKSAR
jgi:hypothetical protein